MCGSLHREISQNGTCENRRRMAVPVQSRGLITGVLRLNRKIKRTPA
ncbi:hypothetical protein [Maridesulfovibrio sp.]|nr:hypothetical protein [Maridesulfovibrio sp.]